MDVSTYRTQPQAQGRPCGAQREGGAAPVGRLAKAALAAHGVLQHSALYRAAAYGLSSSYGKGHRFHDVNRQCMVFMHEFSISDQDVSRSPHMRKMHLALVSELSLEMTTPLLNYFAEHPTENPSILRGLRSAVDKVVGERASVDDVKAYIRRADLKIHPDKCADLVGWEYPGIVYAKGLPANYKYEHALQAAKALYRCNRAVSSLLSVPHYAKRLYEPMAANSPVPSVGQFLAEYSVVSAVLSFAFPALRAYLAGSACVIAALWALKAAQKYLAARKEENCRDVVVYQPPAFGGQGVVKCSGM